MSATRLNVKHPSVGGAGGAGGARQRSTIPKRLTRHSCFTLKREQAFHVRKSLVEYVDEELKAMQTSVFYQRIYILAKNKQLGTLTRPSLVSALTNTTAVTQGTTLSTDPQQQQQQRTSDGTGVAAPSAEPDAVGVVEETTQGSTEVAPAPAAKETTESRASQDESKPITVETTTPTTTTANATEASEPPAAGASVVEAGAEEDEVLTQTFRFDENEEEARQSAEKPVVVEVIEQETEPRDFFLLFKEKLNELHEVCLKLAYTPDPMCGLFLYMGEYTMLMLESSEDMIALYCKELAACIDEFWLLNRIFLTEDHITELYTKTLIARRIPAAHINEKFPTSTPTDEYLMGKQHMIIKDKLLTICRMISESLEPPIAPDSELSQGGSSNNETDDEQELTSERMGLMHSKQHRLTKPPVAVQVSEALPVETYRKLLPEITRIDLVLASTRFYFTLDEFLDIYGNVPFTPDEEGMFWPIQNNYTPPHIFRRTPFDINLAFGDYAAEMKRANEAELQKESLEAEEQTEEPEEPKPKVVMDEAPPE